MENVRLGIVGIGNMGSGHIANFFAGKWKNVTLSAVCDVDTEKLKKMKEKDGSVLLYEKYEDMISSGKIDGVLIATPHYFHPPMAIAAFNKGLNVLSEKPAGVYTKQVKEMNEVAGKSGKVFGIMFNQRTDPIYQKMREMVAGGELGDIKRVIWIITNWYRSQSYYDSGGWRATWEGEGGGTLLNQNPHNLDLWQWICGMPNRVRAFCHFGKYHDIEVEDDVTAYVEYPNGATGVYVTSTGDAPGTNRFEISGNMGKLVAENGKLTFYKLEKSERQFNAEYKGGFGEPKYEKIDVPFSGANDQHVGIVNNWARAILYGEPLLASGAEGINGLEISNAMHLSTWTDNWADIPVNDELFYNLLQEKIKNSDMKKANVSKTLDLSNSVNK